MSSDMTTILTALGIFLICAGIAKIVYALILKRRK